MGMKVGVLFWWLGVVVGESVRIEYSEGVGDNVTEGADLAPWRLLNWGGSCQFRCAARRFV